jgi:prepilin-type N-terminal cleavage/methylation domain-containing protein
MKSLLPKAKAASGFTLVELLVVVSIIVILSAIGLTIYSQAQKSSRLARRTADLKAMQSALETYYSQNAKYPDTGGAWFSECTVAGTFTTKSPGDLVIPGLVPTFMPAMPKDPQMDATNGKACYAYRSDTLDYKIMVYNVGELTNTDLQKNPTLMDPVNSTHPEHTACPTNDDKYQLAIYTFGGKCWK